MRLTTMPSPEAVAAKSAQILADLLDNARERRDVAHIALTGGTSAGAVYERLARLLDDWDGIHLWWGDERCVAPDDAEANYAISVETLIEPAGIPHERVHRMRGELGPEEGARRYAAELAEHVEVDADGTPVLDVVDLGLGPDGHVASLFPDHPVLDVAGASTAAVLDSPKPPPQRITLTLPVLLAARRCLVHTTGAAKEPAVAGLLGTATPSLPVTLLRRDRLVVVVDEDAAPALGAGAA